MTLPELKALYYADRRALISACNADGMTQTDAAKKLGVSLQTLNNIIRRNDIPWRIVRQGQGKTTCRS